MSKTAESSLFEELMGAMEDSIAYSKGKLSLRTTTLLPDPPPVPQARDIVALRKKYKMSQALFAKVLNVSTPTLQSWEQGLRQPSHASARLLEILEKQPQVIECFSYTQAVGRTSASQSRKVTASVGRKYPAEKKPV